MASNKMEDIPLSSADEETVNTEDQGFPKPPAPPALQTGLFMLYYKNIFPI